MTEKKWTFAEHKAQIITGIVTALAIGILTYSWGFAKSIPEKIVVEKGIRETLERFAGDINNSTFDANGYFAGHVEQFWDMTEQSPHMLNDWWNRQFPKLFSNYQLTFDYKTLKVEPGDDYHEATIELYSDYFNQQKQRQVTHEHSTYKLKLDDEYMIVSLVQQGIGK